MNRMRFVRPRLGARLSPIALALLFAAATGCGKGDSSAETAALTSGFILLQQGAPEAPLWDDAHNTLYIVDNVGNRVWKWTDSMGVDGLASASPWAALALPEGMTSLPTPPEATVTLGQAAILADGTLVVARFGTPGATSASAGIAIVNPDGTSALVPNLDAKRHRLGLALDPASGTLYGSYLGATAASGAITKVDIRSGETDVATGFGKIVGLAVASGNLYVSDQAAGKILYAPLSNLPATAAGWSPLASMPKPDQICAGPGGSLFSGQFQSDGTSSAPLAVRQIGADGAVTIFTQDSLDLGISKPSGVSYDPTHKRLFVADSGDSSHIGVHILPVP